MQNEACIKQGSEKESFRQQLITAKATLKFLCGSAEFDAEENAAIAAILTAAEEQRISPKAFVQAAKAAETLSNSKDAVLSIGYSVMEMTEREDAQNLHAAVKSYETARASVIGYQKSLTPSGWDILEE